MMLETGKTKIRQPREQTAQANMAATMTYRRLGGPVFLAVALLLSTLANAHTPERTLQPVARHDGIAKRAGPYNIEFVPEGSCASIYMHSKGNASLGTSRT